MSQRSVLVLVAVLAVLAAGLMLYLPDHGQRAVASPDPLGPSNGRGAAPEQERSALAASEPTEVASSARSREVASEGPVAVEIDPELRDAFWVEGRVVLPDGTPRSEHVEVIANGKPFANRLHYGSALAADGTFRVAFAKETTAGQLTLQARFLYLEREPVIYTTKRPERIVLNPRIGACIRGHVNVTGAGSALRQSIRSGFIRACGNFESGTWQDPGVVERTARISEDLSFEFGGLPPDYVYELSLEGSDAAIEARPRVGVKAGGTVEQDIHALAGASISGRVVDEKQQPVYGAIVMANGDEARSRSTEARSAMDGAFELRGIHPGNVTLSTATRDYASATRVVGDLHDGDRQTGIELVLSSRLVVRGRVQWPDGSPAAFCVIDYDVLERGRGGEAAMQSSTGCNAKGEFTLKDVADVATSVTARRRNRRGTDSATGPIGSWVARATDVKPGTEDLVLTLQAAASFQCRVVDENGRAIPEVSLVAYPDDSNHRNRSRLGLIPGVPGDSGGWLEVPGLYDGEWSVTARAPGFAESKPIRKRLPGEEHVEIVLLRTGTLSGILVDAEDKPVTEARFFIGVWDEEPRRGLVASYSNANVEKRIDSEGQFELQNVHPGHIELTAETLDDNRFATLSLEVSPGESRTGLKLVLHPRPEPPRAK